MKLNQSDRNDMNADKPSTIAVIGANGGIGKQVVEIALHQGIHVTAILRNPSRLALKHPHLKIVEGDILQPAALDSVLSGKDAVVSTIGSNSLKETFLYSKAVENILKSMKHDQMKRALFTSASGLEVNPTHPFFIRFATRQILQRVLKNMYTDLERMEQIIKGSSIDWTIIRPPRLTDNAMTGNYRTAINKIINRPYTISRSDVAHYIVHHLLDQSVVKATVEIAD